MAEGVDEVRGQVRSCRVAAGSCHRDPDAVGAGRDRPGAEPDVADLSLRVAVQCEDSLETPDATVGDDVERPAGSDLLSRLEDEPRRWNRHPLLDQLGEGQRRAEDDARVGVVTTGVAEALDL